MSKNKMDDAYHATILDTRAIAIHPDRYMGWPTICRRKNGELLVVFSGDRDLHICPWGKVQMIRSADNGKTWSKPVNTRNTPLDDRDAGIIETQAGTLVLAWFTSIRFEECTRTGYVRNFLPEKVLRLWERHAEKIIPEIRKEYLGNWTVRSEDGGNTWEKPVRTQGSAPHGMIELGDGRLLYVGRTGDDMAARLTIEESTDDGRSWQQIGAIPTDEEAPGKWMWEPHVVENVNGVLVALVRFQDHRNHPDGGFYYETSFMCQSNSRDGGRTWSVAQKTPMLGFPPHLIRLRNGWLLNVYAKRMEKIHGQYACISRDGGKTWDAEQEILLSLAHNADLGYPASVQLPDDSIYTVYYQIERRDGGNPCIMATHWKLEM